MGRSERARKTEDSLDLETPRPEDRTDPSLTVPAPMSSEPVKSDVSDVVATTGERVAADDTNPGFSFPTVGGAALASEPVSHPALAPETGADDRTQVFDGIPGGESTPRPFRLFVVAGPMSGSDFEIVDEVVIGRSPGVPVHLPDSSVSRRHARLNRNSDDTFLLTDLDSGNGTLVNGEPAKEATIRHGDTVTLGDSVLRLVDSAAPDNEIAELSTPISPVAMPGPVPSPRPEDVASPEVNPASAAPPVTSTDPAATALAVGKVPGVAAPGAGGSSGPAGPGGMSPGRRKLYIAVGAGLVLFFAIAALMQGGAEAPVSTGGGEVVLDAAESLKQEALTRARERQWPEAVKLLEEALTERKDADIERLLTGARAEAAHQRAVDEARRLLEQARFLQARTRLLAVPETADYYDEARALILGIPATLDSTVAQASSLFGDGDKEGAEALVAAILEADPTHAGALGLRERMKEPEPAPVVVQQTPRRPTRPTTTPKKEPEVEAPARPAGPAPEAVEALLAGELNRALRVADAAGGAENEAFARNLRTFDTNLREGLRRVRSERYLEAVTPLTRALDLHREMTGGRSGKLSEEAGKQLANAHYLLGLDSKGDEQLPRASSHFRRALRADPNHALARRQLDHVKSRANNLYIDAYTMENMDREKSRRLYQLVIDTLVPGDETYEKAKRRLEGL